MSAIHMGRHIEPVPGKPGAYRAESETTPGRFYLVTDAGCNCPAYSFRGRCWHWSMRIVRVVNDARRAR